MFCLAFSIQRLKIMCSHFHYQSLQSRPSLWPLTIWWEFECHDFFGIFKTTGKTNVFFLHRHHWLIKNFIGWCGVLRQRSSKISLIKFFSICLTFLEVSTLFLQLLSKYQMYCFYSNTIFLNDAWTRTRFAEKGLKIVIVDHICIIKKIE